MKALLIALVLIFVPSAVIACSFVSERAKLEDMKDLPRGFYGMKAKVLSFAPGPLSGEGKLTVQILESFGESISGNVSLKVTMCAAATEQGKTYYFLARKGQQSEELVVENYPAMALKQAKDEHINLRVY